MTLSNIRMDTRVAEALRKYQTAINKIDDYFEYSNESEKDKTFVREVLSKLTKDLSN